MVGVEAPHSRIYNSQVSLEDCKLILKSGLSSLKAHDSGAIPLAELPTLLKVDDNIMQREMMLLGGRQYVPKRCEVSELLYLEPQDAIAT